MSGEEAGALAPHLGMGVEGFNLREMLCWWLSNGTVIDRGMYGVGGEEEVVDWEVVLSANLEVGMVAGTACKEVQNRIDRAIGAVLYWDDGVIWRGFCGGGLQRGEDVVERR